MSMSRMFDMEVVGRLATRAKALLVGAGVVGMFFGGWHTYRAVRDGEQLEISCADYIRQRPDNHWLKLTGCEYDVDNYVYILSSKSGKSVSKVFFALRPIGDTSGTTTIVVVRDDEATRSMIETFNDGDDPSEATIKQFAADIQKPVEGIVASGLDIDQGDKDKIVDPKLNLGLTKNFVMISNGAHPRLVLGVLLLIGSTLFLVVAAVVYVRERRRRRNAPPPAARPPAPRPPGRPRPTFEEDPIRASEEPL
jgi:hypothetical protein